MLDLASISASQAEVNQTANALAAELKASGNDNVVLSDTLYMLVRSHLRVIYPRLWTVSTDAIQKLVAEAADIIPETPTEPETEAPTKRTGLQAA